MSRIDEIKAKWAAASPRPWKRSTGYEQSDPGNYVYVGNGAIVCAQQDGTDCDLSDEDAVAISDAPSDVAWLTGEVERLTTELRMVEGLLKSDRPGGGVEAALLSIRVALSDEEERTEDARFGEVKP